MFKKLLNKTTFIVGNKKNSGKTTFLNSALVALRGAGKIAYLSIGVDGETKDQIFGFSKPKVMTEKGDFVVTLESALKYTRATYKLLKIFPYKTVLGRPVLLEIKSRGSIEIIGPENNTQLKEILEHLSKKRKIKTILIDGAINRITQVSAFDNAYFVFILRVDRDRVQSSADELKKMFMLVSISKVSPKVLKSYETVRISGALTKQKGDAFSHVAKNILVEDFTKVFLTYRELVSLLRGHKLFFQTKFKLLFPVINLFGADKNTFIHAFGDKKQISKITINEIPGY